MLEGVRLGFAMTGSFCTLERTLRVLPEFVRRGALVVPILSEMAYYTDSRFMPAQELIGRLKEITGRDPIHSIVQTEPIGPKKLLDLLIVAPATGNTIGKLAYGITDTSVTMACKAHWRNLRPVIIAISTNDGRSGSARGIELLKKKRDTYLAPYEPDDPQEKPDSFVAKMEMLPDFAEHVLQMRAETGA